MRQIQLPIYCFQVKKFLPYHQKEKQGKFKIIFIDECGFNLNNQGNLYGWGQKGSTLTQKVPVQQDNTTLCAAIDNKGLVAFQMFDKGMKWQDYLGFMSNLVNCLKLGRNTSFDEVLDLDRINRVDSYSEAGKRGIVFIMDNATIHKAIEVKKTLKNYNILYLASYSPMLNIIELWFSQLRKKAGLKYFKTRYQLRKGLALAVNQIPQSFYHNTYRRLLKVLYMAYNQMDL